MKSFLDWLDEVVQTRIVLPGEPTSPLTKGKQDPAAAAGPAMDTTPGASYTPPTMTKRKDAPGFPLLDKGGFRPADMGQIQKESPQVERWLDKATSKFGVHWLVLYMPPEEGTQTIDDPETAAQAVSVGAAKRLGKPGWDKYKSYSHQSSTDKLTAFIKQYEAQGVNLDNTIVYVKPTSRVHTLGPWQQAHNIGHAIWGNARKKGLYATFNKKLRQIVYDMQQQAHLKAGGDEKIPMPNAQEITIMLGRVLGIGKSFRKIFTAGVDDETGQTDFAKPSFKVNTALNGYDEAMYDLLAVYLNSGGKIPIKTGGEIAGTGVEDRSAAMEPNAAIMKRYKPRDWVWKELASDKGAWESAVASLEEILEQTFKAATWNNAKGPIYATEGYITTGA